METFAQDPLAINVSSGADSSHESHLLGNVNEITPALPSPNAFDEAAASSTDILSSEKEAATGGGGIQVEGSCRCFSLEEVQRATNDFDDALVIGSGGFGKVYKGIIDNGGATTTVAVKRLNGESKQGAEEFWTEVKLLSKLQHTHLVQLIGYCNRLPEMILVYEYMARGTLASHLYKTSREENGERISYLTWGERLNICLGAARGLDYLHNGTEQSIIHRDVKSTNILLDENLVAKVSDFGLSKSITSHTTTHVSTNVKGTFGYLDPDYFYTKRLTKKSDVYAFGVVLLEVLCGRPPVDTRLQEEQISLIQWAQRCIKKRQYGVIIDHRIQGEKYLQGTPRKVKSRKPRKVKYFAILANKCLHMQPKERPTMAQVVKSLEFALAAHACQMINCCGFRLILGIEVRGVPPDSVIEIMQRFQYPRFSLAEIRAATNNFNDSLLINEDVSFRLYKGRMVGGTLVVAIKRYTSRGSLREIEAEIQVQSLSGHPNIVSLIGRCVEMNEIILVYEYMINGTLHSLLHETGKDPLLWEERLKICIDIARELEYLHTNVEFQGPHGNVKPSHIFLDDKWVAKVADFELSSCEATYQEFRYHDVLYEERTKASDVYAFGVVLLEVLCAKEAYTRLPYMDEDPLLLWLKGGIKRGTIDEIIDPYLIGKIAPDCLRYYVNIALSCLIKEGIRRPSMGDVLGSLQSTLQLQEAWEKSLGMGDELSLADVPGSYNDVISVSSEFTIGEQSFLVSDLVQPGEIMSPSLPFSDSSSDGEIRSLSLQSSDEEIRSLRSLSLQSSDGEIRSLRSLSLQSSDGEISSLRSLSLQSSDGEIRSVSLQSSDSE